MTYTKVKIIIKNCEWCSKKFKTTIKHDKRWCDKKCVNKWYHSDLNPKREELVYKKRKSATQFYLNKRSKMIKERLSKGLPALMKRKFKTKEEALKGRRERDREYKQRDYVKKKTKEYLQKPEIKKKLNENKKKYYKTKEGKKKRDLYAKKHYKINQDNIKAKARSPKRKARTLELYHQRIKNDIQFKMTRVLRSRLASAVKSYKQKGIVFKKGKTLELLGCSMKHFLKHIESQFKEGMSWENHGLQNYKTSNKWNIDHIKPLYDFDLTKEEDQKKCFHYTNLQPLWQNKNREKWYN